MKTTLNPFQINNETINQQIEHYPIKLRQNSDVKINDYLKETKSILLQSKKYRKYIAEYSKLTQIPTFKVPDIEFYPLFTSSCLIPQSKTQYAAKFPKINKKKNIFEDKAFPLTTTNQNYNKKSDQLNFPLTTKNRHLKFSLKEILDSNESKSTLYIEDILNVFSKNIDLSLITDKDQNKILQTEKSHNINYIQETNPDSKKRETQVTLSLEDYNDLLAENKDHIRENKESSLKAKLYSKKQPNKTYMLKLNSFSVYFFKNSSERPTFSYYIPFSIAQIFYKSRRSTILHLISKYFSVNDTGVKVSFNYQSSIIKILDEFPELNTNDFGIIRDETKEDTLNNLLNDNMYINDQMRNNYILRTTWLTQNDEYDIFICPPEIIFKYDDVLFKEEINHNLFQKLYKDKFKSWEHNGILILMQQSTFRYIFSKLINNYDGYINKLLVNNVQLNEVSIKAKTDKSSVNLLSANNKEIIEKSNAERMSNLTASTKNNISNINQLLKTYSNNKPSNNPLIGDINKKENDLFVIDISLIKLLKLTFKEKNIEEIIALNTTNYNLNTDKPFESNSIIERKINKEDLCLNNLKSLYFIVTNNNKNVLHQLVSYSASYKNKYESPTRHQSSIKQESHSISNEAVYYFTFEYFNFFYKMREIWSIQTFVERIVQFNPLTKKLIIDSHLQKIFKNNKANFIKSLTLIKSLQSQDKEKNVKDSIRSKPRLINNTIINNNIKVLISSNQRDSDCNNIKNTKSGYNGSFISPVRGNVKKSFGDILHHKPCIFVIYLSEENTDNNNTIIDLGDDMIHELSNEKNIIKWNNILFDNKSLFFTKQHRARLDKNKNTCK